MHIYKTTAFITLYILIYIILKLLSELFLAQTMDDVNSPDEDENIQKSMWSRIQARRNAKTQAVSRSYFRLIKI